jgi:hypothetical protein
MLNTEAVAIIAPILDQAHIAEDLEVSLAMALAVRFCGEIREEDDDDCGSDGHK